MPDPTQPVIYHYGSQPRYTAPAQLTFSRKNKKGACMRMSTTLYKLLGGSAATGVALIEHGKAIYITRADQNGHRLNASAKVKSGVSSIAVYSKAMVTELMTKWGYGFDDVVTVPVLKTPLTVDGLTLDPELYPHPLYRLILDQAVIKPEV